MAQQPLTPEKQLLKLIEGGTPQSSLKTAAIKHRGLSIFSLGAWTGRFSFFKDRFKKQFKDTGFGQFEVRLINRVLGTLVFILALYFIISLPFSVRASKKMVNLQLKAQDASRSIDGKDAPVLKTAESYYLEKVRIRDIFKIGKKIASSEGVAKAPSAKLTEATQTMKLVGISWSDDPDAMIEDSKAQKTFFVKRGQSIGNVKVQAILKDKVILSMDGEEIELK
jgi:hypothetical protein